MIEYIKGNLIKLSKEDQFDVIVHGCNCKKNWGKGIALTMKKEYPLAYETDCNSNPKLGEYSVCDMYDTIIINAYTQVYPGRPKYQNDTEYKRYNAIKSIFTKINQNFKGKLVGIPMIGAGLAGLDWDNIYNIIDECCTEVDINVVQYDNT